MDLPKFRANWDGFRGQVSVTWDKLSEDELLKIEGNLSDLVKLISDKYGEKKSVIEDKVAGMYKGYLEKKEELAKTLHEMREDIDERARSMGSNIRDRADALQKNAKEKVQRIREENIDPALEKSEEYIKVHPFTAVLGAFGIGVLLGGVIGLLTKKD